MSKDENKDIKAKIGKFLGKKPDTKAVVKAKPKEVQVKNLQNVNPQTLIMSAIDKGVSIEILERLLAMRERLQKEEAERAFREAMSAFQAECPVIPKRKAVMNSKEKGGGLRYKYAPIDDIIVQVQPLIKKNGLSYDIDTEQKESIVDATVTIFHILGHSKKSTFGVPIDPKAYMTDQQKWIAAQTVSKRVAFCNAFGILTGDEDTDGNGGSDDIGEKENETQERKEKLETLPPDVQKGLRLLGYGINAAFLFCNKWEWKPDKIKFETNKIFDAKAAV